MVDVGLRSTGRRFVHSHGKRIEVETLEPGAPRRTATDSAPLKDRLIGCPIWWLQRVLPLVKSSHELVVTLYIWRRHVVTKRRSFSVPNNELEAIGVRRRVKYKALAKLKEAGLITYKPQRGKVPVVTIQARKP